MAIGNLAAVAGAYVVGMFPTALVVARRRGHDPLREGSGNPGASNVYRTAGRRAGALVLVGDMIKGLAPTALALALGSRPLALACWLGAVLGHVLPLAGLRRGGKGVATAGGGALVLFPLAAPACIVVFVLVVWRTKVAALGSLAMAVLLPVLAAVERRRWSETAVAAAVALLIVVRHHDNLRRLLAGAEHTVQV